MSCALDTGMALRASQVKIQLCMCLCAVTALQVLYNELPIYVTPELADTVAFVGRAVRMLKTRAAGFTGQDLLPFK